MWFDIGCSVSEIVHLVKKYCQTGTLKKCEVLSYVTTLQFVLYCNFQSIFNDCNTLYTKCVLYFSMTLYHSHVACQYFPEAHDFHLFRFKSSNKTVSCNANVFLFVNDNYRKMLIISSFNGITHRMRH